MAIDTVAHVVAHPSRVRGQNGNAVAASIRERYAKGLSVAGSDSKVGARVEIGKLLTARGVVSGDEAVNLDEIGKGPWWSGTDHLKVGAHPGAVHCLGGSKGDFASFAFPVGPNPQQLTWFWLPTINRRQDLLMGWWIGHV